MTQILLSSDDHAMLIKALQAKSPEVVQARMAHALLLMSEGLSVEDVAGVMYVSAEVVEGWKTAFSSRSGRKAA